MTRPAARRRASGGLLLSTALLGGAPPDLGLFAQAASTEERPAREALKALAGSWKDAYAALLVDLARFMPAPGRLGTPSGLGATAPPRPGDVDEGPAADPFQNLASAPQAPGAQVRERLVRFLEKQTGQRFGHDLARWRQWLWNRPYTPHPDYAAFKAALYGRIDPHMGAFFAPGVPARIRLDEVDWGGVRPNGIPPLDHPAHVPAPEARYLGDRDVVFGVALNGESRAYPKRILAWHELARDRLGGVDLTIVYCTLCGTVVPYGSEVGGTLRTFGTSGLLYRSNKLMFDEESMSLWSSAEGRPVVGPLAGSALVLRDYPVVTTTWRDWRRAHPETTVLSLATGFQRDYSEGAAYRDYFATDRLMFTVPRTDPRLKNKDEVLALQLAPPGEGGRRPLAVAVSLLRRERLLPLRFAGRSLVVVTSEDGANRVYDAGEHRFTRVSDTVIEDGNGRRFAVTEDALRPLDGRPPDLPRLPARRAFWFGWYAQFPDTELVTSRR